MPRIEAANSLVLVPNPRDARPAVHESNEGPTNRPAQGSLTELAQMRREPSAAAGPDSMARRVPVPPPLPAAGFNRPAKLKLEPPRGNPRLRSGPDEDGTPNAGAAHLGRNDERTGVFVGTGKWSGSDLPRSTRPNRTSPLQQHELQQAAYQLGSRVQGDPIEDPSEIEHLDNATATVHRTRQDLKHGRGNILSDLIASDWASAARSQVAYEAGKMFGVSANVGVALAYHAGNCDHNAAINSRRYSVMLQERGETVSSKGSRELKHAWAQLDRPDKILPGGETEPRHSIVLDSWMDGPPVRAKDSSLASVMRDADLNQTFGRDTGLRNLQAMHHARDAAGPGGPLHEMTESALRRYTSEPPEFPPFTEHSTIDDRFAAATTASLAAQPALSQELMAAATARTAYNLNIHEATRPATSDAIIDKAYRLHMPERPPVVAAPDPAL